MNGEGVAPIMSGEGAVWNEEEKDISRENRKRFALRGPPPMQSGLPFIHT